VKTRRKATARPTVRSLLEEIERARYRERALEAALLRRLEGLAAVEAKAEARIRHMENSLSWRITRPLRLLRKIMRRSKQITNTIKRPLKT
jgi:hypothetical protein